MPTPPGSPSKGGAAGDAAEEAPRRVIIHFNVPKTIMLADPTGSYNAEGKPFTTEEAINGAITKFGWGTIDMGSKEWELVHPEPSAERPRPDLISFKEYLDRMYPIENVDDFTKEENGRLQREKSSNFCQPNNPGQKLKPVLEQMLKCVSYSKPLLKASGLAKPTLDDTEASWDPAQEQLQNLMRYGRYILLPSFWNLLLTLTKAKREFCIILHSLAPNMEEVVTEVNAFCECQHPGYNGANKTKKTILNGDKGSADLRIKPEYVGNVERASMFLEFARRNCDDSGVEGMFKPTSYANHGANYHWRTAPITFRTLGMYAGLVHEISTETKVVAITEDHDFWGQNEFTSSGGQLFLFDSGETEVQQIYFDGSFDNETNTLCPMEVVGEAVKSYEELKDVFIHKVDVYGSVTNPNYFVDALAMCEANWANYVEESRIKKSPPTELLPTDLDARTYLDSEIMPALFPALEQCCKVRPEDPMEFLAFYLMRYGQEGYNKTLVTED